MQYRETSNIALGRAYPVREEPNVKYPRIRDVELRRSAETFTPQCQKGYEILNSDTWGAYHGRGPIVHERPSQPDRTTPCSNVKETTKAV
jgi:hypothetical protein